MDDVKAISTIIGVLKQLDLDTQKRVLRAVRAYLDVETSQTPSGTPDLNEGPISGRSKHPFSQDRTISPKDFLRDKNPPTDVERVACLAYYLAHYQDTPHFKTVDISALNTEAAQPKFSNASVAVENARTRGYLVSASKGTKQISAVGEKFVELLPDRDAAKDFIRNARRRSGRKSPSPKGE